MFYSATQSTYRSAYLKQKSCKIEFRLVIFSGIYDHVSLMRQITGTLFSYWFDEISLSFNATFGFSILGKHSFRLLCKESIDSCGCCALSDSTLVSLNDLFIMGKKTHLRKSLLFFFPTNLMMTSVTFNATRNPVCDLFSQFLFWKMSNLQKS